MSSDTPSEWALDRARRTHTSTHGWGSRMDGQEVEDIALALDAAREEGRCAGIEAAASIVHERWARLCDRPGTGAQHRSDELYPLLIEVRSLLTTPAEPGGDKP